MTEPRPLSNDLTDQGKYQLAHGEPSTTHTPGPWVAIGKVIKEGLGRRNSVTVTRIDSRGKFVKGCDEANARLMAAAPDLVLALQAMLCQFQDHEQYGEDDAAAINIARAAIAKATGGAE